MNALLLTVSVIMNILSAGILRNDFCKKEIRSSADLHTFNAISSILSAAALALIALFGKSLCLPSMYTLGMGIVFGIATALCAVLARLYGLGNCADTAVRFDWGNGVLYDEEKLWQGYVQMVKDGLIAPEVALGWRFHMPVDTPEALARIREKLMP